MFGAVSELFLAQRSEDGAWGCAGLRSVRSVQVQQFDLTTAIIMHTFTSTEVTCCVESLGTYTR